MIRFLACLLVCGGAFVAFAPARATVSNVYLSKPSGPFAIGREAFDFVDRSRTDPEGSQKEEKREFMVLVWYPADAGTGAKQATWIPEAWAQFEVPGLLQRLVRSNPSVHDEDVLAILHSIKPNALEEAPISKGPQKFPVLVFEPGATNMPTLYTSLLEEMVSQGYVVFGIVPTYCVPGVSFPDGRVVLRSKTPDYYLWEGDMKFTIDQAQLWNSDSHSKYYKRLDLEHVGAFGHSAGASATTRAMRLDPRIKAGVSLDAGTLNLNDATEKPILLLNAENAPFFIGHPDVVAKVKKERNDFCRRSQTCFQIELAGTVHMSLSDEAVIPAYDIQDDGAAVVAAERALVREFFGEIFRGQRSNLIRKGSSDFPIIKVDPPPHD